MHRRNNILRKGTEVIGSYMRGKSGAFVNIWSKGYPAKGKCSLLIIGQSLDVCKIVSRSAEKAVGWGQCHRSRYLENLVPVAAIGRPSFI